MANQDIFGLEKKKKKLANTANSSMASEYGEEMIGRKIASGELARETAKTVAKSAIKPDSGGYQTEETVSRDMFGNETKKTKVRRPSPNKGLSRDEEFERDERMHDEPSGPEPDVTPEEREEAVRTIRESQDRVTKAEKARRAAKEFGEGLKDGLKQSFSDPFGIGKLKKKKEE